MAIKQVRRCPTSRVLRDMQIKTTMKLKQNTPTRMTTMKMAENSSHWRACRVTRV